MICLDDEIDNDVISHKSRELKKLFSRILRSFQDFILLNYWAGPKENKYSVKSFHFLSDYNLKHGFVI